MATPLPWQQGNGEDYAPRVVFHAPADEDLSYVPVCQCESAEDAAAIVAASRLSQSGATRLDKDLRLVFPLAGTTKDVRVVVDLKKQVVRFKEPGKKWKSIALWLIAESAEVNP